MTIEEKREILNEYCNSIDFVGCKNCKLAVGGWTYTTSFGCPRICVSPEEDLDRALKLIDGEWNNEPSNDPVNRPAHYTDGKIEVIDFIEDKKLGFCLGNAVKYISRAGKKDPTKEVEDLKKARWYIDRRIKEIQEAT